MFAEPATVAPHGVNDPWSVRLQLTAEFDEVNVQSPRVWVEWLAPDNLIQPPPGVELVRVPQKEGQQVERPPTQNQFVPAAPGLAGNQVGGDVQVCGSTGFEVGGSAEQRRRRATSSSNANGLHR